MGCGPAELYHPDLRSGVERCYSMAAEQGSQVRNAAENHQGTVI